MTTLIREMIGDYRYDLLFNTIGLFSSEKELIQIVGSDNKYDIVNYIEDVIIAIDLKKGGC